MNQKHKTDRQLLIDRRNALKSRLSDLTHVKLDKRDFNTEEIKTLREQINEVEQKLNSN